MISLDITDSVVFDSITQEMFPKCMPRVFTCRVNGSLLEMMLCSANRWNIYTHSKVNMVVTSADSYGRITLVELVSP